MTLFLGGEQPPVGPPSDWVILPTNQSWYNHGDTILLGDEKNPPDHAHGSKLTVDSKENSQSGDSNPTITDQSGSSNSTSTEDTTGTD